MNISIEFSKLLVSNKFIYWNAYLSYTVWFIPALNAQNAWMACLKLLGAMLLHSYWRILVGKALLWSNKVTILLAKILLHNYLPTIGIICDSAQSLSRLLSNQLLARHRLAALSEINIPPNLLFRIFLLGLKNSKRAFGLNGRWKYALWPC